MRTVLCLLLCGLASAAPARYYDLPGSAWRIEPAGDSAIAFGTYEGTFGMLNTDSGKVEWNNRLDGFPFAIATAPEPRAPAVIAATAGGTLWAFDRRGRNLWKFRDALPLYSAALGRLADGTPFAATGGVARKVIVLSADGKVLAEYPVSMLVHRLAAADLDGDGASELLVLDSRNDLEALRFDGKGLTRVWRKTLVVPEQYRNWENPGARFYAMSIATGDVDGDGKPEIVLGDAYWNKQPVMVLDSRGEVRWISPKLPAGNSWTVAHSPDHWYEFYSTAFVRIAEVDRQSAGAEVLVVTGGNLRIFSSTGKLLASQESALGFADLCTAGNRLYLGSTPNGDRTIYGLALDQSLAASFASLHRNGLAREIGENLDRLAAQVRALPAARNAGTKIGVRFLSAGRNVAQMEAAARSLEWFRKEFPYPSLQPYTTVSVMEKTPPLDPSGKPWNPARWKVDAINGTMTVEQIVGIAREIERLRIPTLFGIGHSCMPFITLEAAEKILQAAPNYTVGFESAEDEEEARVPTYMQHFIGPLSDLCRRYGGKIVSTKNKGAWWVSMPPNDTVYQSLFTGERRGGVTAFTEDSNSRTPELNLMGRMGLRQAGLIRGFAASIIQDLFSGERFHQWEYPRSGHPYLRLLAAQTALGADQLELRITQTIQQDGKFEWTLLGRESTAILLHLVGKGILTPPAPGQMAGLSPVGIAMHSPPAQWLADAHNGHQPWAWQGGAEMENAVLPHNGSTWGNTPTPEHALTKVLFDKQRQFGYHVPPTPFGPVAIVPAQTDLSRVEGVKEWWHTDGLAVWRDGGKRLTGAAAAEAVRKSVETARAGQPFAVEGADVLFQAIRLSATQYRLVLIDPGWLDPQQRDVTVRVQVAGDWAARDVLSGQSVTMKGRAFPVRVPAGSLRIIDVLARTSSFIGLSPKVEPGPPPSDRPCFASGALAGVSLLEEPESQS